MIDTKNSLHLVNGILIALIISVYSSVLAANEQQEAISSPVLELHNNLIEIMKNADSTSLEERYRIMETTVNKNFDMPLISRIVLSRYWKSLDEQQQTRFINLFTRLTLYTYVTRFNSYDNQGFTMLSVEPMKKNRFMVKTEFALNNTDDEKVSFNYIVQQSDAGWQIISVIANGINDLSLKRAEYSTVIKDRGYEGLVASLNKKISDLQDE